MAFLSSSHRHTPFFFFTKAAALLLLSLHAICCSCQNNNTTNTLLQGQSISQNHTLISQNQRYALGFFSPTNPPSKYYIGIWFNQIPKRTVVWVCNRENPLTDPSSGSFTIAPDGNLALLNATDQAILWSTNISSIDTNTSAVLLDSGNLVLQRIANDTNNFANSTIWQSFDNPSNTLLPDMQLYMNLSSRTGNRVVSWRTPHDPSPGEFSTGFDPETALQLMTWRGGTQVWMRNGVYGTKNFFAMRDNESNTFIGMMVPSDYSSISFSYRMAEGSKTLWMMLDHEGVDRYFLWEPTSNTWRKAWSDPSACRFYDPCGPNALCNLNAKALECVCLRGYMPKSAKEWQEGNYKGGCRREVELGCGDGDGFANVSGVMLPDGFRMVRDASREECEGWCARRCGCTAYAFANVPVIGSRTRCLVWEGELVDAKVFDAGGQELYLRLAKSEFQKEGSSSKTKRVILAAVLPILALGIIPLACSLYICKERSTVKRCGKNEIMVIENLKIPEMFAEKRPKDLLALDFNKLVVSTNNFSIENKLGEGGFGPVFKGKLPGGQELAIKMLSTNSNQGFTQFRNEVELIARLQHTNLVKLFGWCIHDNEKMLIYEYMPNKSLDKFIFDHSKKTILSWATRFHIIHGIAEGLLYLHRYSRLRVIHRDLKTSNILLDEFMNPKISDFGLAKIMEKNQNEANTERVSGTLGYMSPEYAFDGLFSEKSDVFSFGVILLEIITGKRVTGYYPYKKSFNLLGYVWEHWKEDKNLELLDASIDDEFSKQEVLKCFQIALLCVQESAFDRPSMQSLVPMLTTKDAYLPSPKEPAFSAERCHDHASSLSKSFKSTPLNVSDSSHIVNNNP